MKELQKNFDKLGIKNKIKAAIETGNWMVRRSDNGVAYNGFEWEPIGK